MDNVPAELRAVKFSPVAVESVACVRFLQEIAAKGDPDNIGPRLLDHLWHSVAEAVVKHCPVADPSKGIDENREKLQLALSVAVLSTYFCHQGDWREIRKHLERMFRETHADMPEEVAESLLSRATQEVALGLRKQIAAVKAMEAVEAEAAAEAAKTPAGSDTPPPAGKLN